MRNTHGWCGLPQHLCMLFDFSQREGRSLFKEGSRTLKAPDRMSFLPFAQVEWIMKDRPVMRLSLHLRLSEMEGKYVKEIRNCL